MKDKLKDCSEHRFMESASERQKPCECCSESTILHGVLQAQSSTHIPPTSIVSRRLKVHCYGDWTANHGVHILSLSQ